MSFRVRSATYLNTRFKTLTQLNTNKIVPHLDTRAKSGNTRSRKVKKLNTRCNRVINVHSRVKSAAYLNTRARAKKGTKLEYQGQEWSLTVSKTTCGSN